MNIDIVKTVLTYDMHTNDIVEIKYTDPIYKKRKPEEPEIPLTLEINPATDFQKLLFLHLLDKSMFDKYICFADNTDDTDSTIKIINDDKITITNIDSIDIGDMKIYYLDYNSNFVYKIDCYGTYKEYNSNPNNRSNNIYFINFIMYLQSIKYFD